MRTSRFFAYRLIKTSENILDKLLGLFFAQLRMKCSFSGAVTVDVKKFY